MSHKLRQAQALRDQLIDLEDSGAKLTGTEVDFIAGFDRAVMDAEDGVADTHYTGLESGRAIDSHLTTLERAQQILNAHQLTA